MSARPGFAAATQLLSIVGLGIPAGRYVSSFDIQTWGVRVLAVCHIPPGWTVSGGQDADPGGTLSGSASEGVTFLDPSHLGDLNGLFLVEVADVHAAQGDLAKDGWYLPPTFDGKIEIGRYGNDTDTSPRRLVPSNIALVAAARCADPS